MNILLLLVILFQMETKKEAFSVELQQYVLSQPVCVIRGLATALKLGTFTSENLAYFTASNFYQNIIVLFSWLFPSHLVSGMTDGIPTPCCPVRLFARSQSSTCHASLVIIFPSCFWSSSLPFPWYIRPQHFHQYVFVISPHHMPVPVQSSLRGLFASLRHSPCSWDVFVLDLVNMHIHRTQHPHLIHLNCSPRFFPI